MARLHNVKDRIEITCKVFNSLAPVEPPAFGSRTFQLKERMYNELEEFDKIMFLLTKTQEQMFECEQR